MRFAASQHQAKAKPFIEALISHGHDFVAGTGVDAYFLDLDSPWNRGLYEPHLATGAKVFLYPHGYNATFLYACERYQADPRVTAHFVMGPGQRDLEKTLGVPVPAYVVGFPYCDRKPFRATDNPTKILFAASHPYCRDGSLPQKYLDRNKAILDELLTIPGLEITVRHLMDLELNGLERVPGVTFTEGVADNGTDQIDEADVVISDGTFAAIAVARGVPTIMTDAVDDPLVSEPDGSETTPRDWHLYKPLLRYPIDIVDGPLSELIPRAARSEDEIAGWRERWIGPQFDPTKFVQLVNELRREPLLEDEVRERVVVALADEVADNPDLLAQYARVMDGDETTTLVLYAPDADEAEIAGRLGEAIAAAGLDESTAPDMLLTALPGYEVHERTLAARAAAILTAREHDGPFGDLPDALGTGDGVPHPAPPATPAAEPR